MSRHTAAATAMPGTPGLKIAPSILNADFGRLAEEIQAAEAGGADWIHVDIMDGVFVPNITMGPMVVEAIRRATSLPLDVHLMVEDPRRYVEAFRDAGADWLTIHLEADRHPHRTLDQIRSRGAKAGLALNPGTPVALAEDLIAESDLLLIMSVNPGFGGQSFIDGALPRLEQARRLVQARNSACEVEVDGGIKPHNALQAAKAGATVLVAGSFVYQGGADGPGAQIAALRKALEKA